MFHYLYDLRSYVLGLYGRVLVGQGEQGGFSGEAARSFCLSKTDPTMAKARPIGDVGLASEIMYLRKAKCY